MFRNILRTIQPVLLILILLASALSGCSENAASEEDRGLAMASMEGMPAEVKNAPVTVQQAYQFAVANPDTVNQFPCYCGCGKMGHTSNYSCYVQQVDGAGKITYDTHALGCSICVDITLDVMRLQKEEKSIPEIQTYIENAYSKYGPSNITGASPAAGAQTTNNGNTPICTADLASSCAD